MKEKLVEAGFRVDVDERNEKLGYRLREAQIKKIPVQLVVGDGEVENGTVNVRRYGSQASESLSIQDLIQSLVKEVKEKR